MRRCFRIAGPAEPGIASCSTACIKVEQQPLPQSHLLAAARSI